MVRLGHVDLGARGHVGQVPLSKCGAVLLEAAQGEREVRAADADQDPPNDGQRRARGSAAGGTEVARDGEHADEHLQQAAHPEETDHLCVLDDDLEHVELRHDDQHGEEDRVDAHDVEEHAHLEIVPEPGMLGGLVGDGDVGDRAADGDGDDDGADDEGDFLKIRSVAPVKTKTKNHFFFFFSLKLNFFFFHKMLANKLDDRNNDGTHTEEMEKQMDYFHFGTKKSKYLFSTPLFFVFVLEGEYKYIKIDSLRLNNFFEKNYNIQIRNSSSVKKKIDSN